MAIDLKFCHSGKISPNLVTLVSTLIESRKREGGKNERVCSLKCHLNTENYLAWRRIVSASNWRTLTIGGSITVHTYGWSPVFQVRIQLIHYIQQITIYFLCWSVPVFLKLETSHKAILPPTVIVL